MATQDQINDITALYIGYFDRAPDPAGLQFWIDELDNGRDFNTIAADFAASPEAEALYPYLTTPGVSSPAAFITSIYVNMFNRAPDADGLAFWVDVLESGDVSVADMIEAIINGARDDAGAGTFDRTVLDNKIEVGLDFAQKTGDTPGFEYDADAAAAAVAVLDGVTEDPATVDAGKAAVDEFLNPTPVGETLTLTTGSDNLVGTDQDDVFNAPLDRAGELPVSEQTLQGIDNLDGGAGNNVLNAQLNGFSGLFDAQDPTIANIQQYNLTAASDMSWGGLDLANASGYEVLQNINSRGDLTLDNVNLTDGEAPTIALTNVRAGTTTNVNYDTEVGAIETQNVEVSNVGSNDGKAALFIDTDGDGIDTLNLTASNGTNLFVDVDAGGVETLNLDVSGGTDLLLNDDADGIENLNITGQDELALEGTADFENLVNLNSEEYTGDLELNISGSEVLESVLTGDGGDVITADVDNFGDITTPTTVDLGQGENRLILRDGFSISAGELSSLDFTVNTVDNAQTLELVNVDLYGTASLGLDGVSALETLELRNFDSNGNDLSINGGPDDLTINAISNFTPAADFDMEGGQLTVNGVRNLVVNTGDDLAIDGGLKGATLETLELNAADDADLFISTGFDPNGELDALTSIEVNAGVAEGASNSDAYVRIDDANGSLTTGLTSLESISVAAQDDATLILNGTNDALTGAQTVLADALAAQTDAATALVDAESAQTAAETALDNAQADQDAKVLAQAAAAADQAAAQADFDAAEAAQITAQGVYDAALADDIAADAAVVTAEGALDTAQDTVDTFNAYLAAFPFDDGLFTSAQNISDIKTYILANNDLTTDQKNALIDSVPTITLATPNPFNRVAEFNAYLADASLFLTADLDIATLTTTWNDAVADALLTQTALDDATTDLNNANGDLTTATTDLNTANAALDAADAALATADAAVATATDELLDAVVEVDHAEHALNDADAAVIAAQAAVDAALDQGTGFEALHTVTVEATDGDADVELTDVYGAVSLDVTAADNAWIDLFNTEVTSVTATAAHVDIDAAGDTVGNSALTSITVTSVSADITLADNVSGFETLDVSGVSTNLVVNTSAADFGALAAGQFVEYQIDATSDDDNTTVDVDFSGNLDAREVYNFVGDNIGNVVIDNFTAGADPTSGDRLDLSGFAASQGELVFTDNGTDTVITDLGGGLDDFGGSITLTGVTGADLSFNIIYG